MRPRPPPGAVGRDLAELRLQAMRLSDVPGGPLNAAGIPSLLALPGVYREDLSHGEAAPLAAAAMNELSAPAAAAGKVLLLLKRHVVSVLKRPFNTRVFLQSNPAPAIVLDPGYAVGPPLA